MKNFISRIGDLTQTQIIKEKYLNEAQIYKIQDTAKFVGALTALPLAAVATATVSSHTTGMLALTSGAASAIFTVGGAFVLAATAAIYAKKGLSELYQSLRDAWQEHRMEQQTLTQQVLEPMAPPIAPPSTTTHLEDISTTEGSAILQEPSFLHALQKRRQITASPSSQPTAPRATPPTL